MTLTPLILTAAAAVCIASASVAQTPRTATYSGSTWGFFLLETGFGASTVFTGQPSMLDGDTDAVITIVSRDGRPLGEADRNLAIGLARGLCEQSGRHFNTQTRGHWLSNGRLGFHGACTQW